MKAVLGLDLGEKRIGVAVTDEAGMMAMPLMTLSFESRKKLLAELQELIERHRVGKVVVGLPKTLKGEWGPAAQKITAHVEWFKVQIPLPWILWDERFSTAEVERLLIDADVSRAKRKEVRDRLAAQRILQSYLDYESRQEHS